MSEKSEKLSMRLVEILSLFNSGKALSVAELATKFGVTKRTIQKDLNTRMNCLHIERGNDNLYRMAPSWLGKFTADDIELFSCLCGINGLFPQINQKLIARLLNNKQNTTFSVIGHNYESISQREEEFYKLEEAISQRRTINFEYKEKSYRNLSPYKLISQSGIWYLAALDVEGNIKSFHFNNIKRLYISSNTFSIDTSISNIINESTNIWFEEDNDIQSYTIRIEKEIVPYFMRRDMLQQQETVKVNEDGSMILKTHTGNKQSLIHKLLYWIPNIYVLEPVEFQDEIVNLMKKYIASKCTKE